MTGKRRSGVGLAYSIIILSVMMILSSLIIDYGRVQLVKTQLQGAADAAAMAAAGAIPDGINVAQNVAVSIASANLVDGAPLSLDPDDIEFGTWDPIRKQFTVLTGLARADAQAVRVWARRSAAKGNAIELPFTKWLGRDTCDVSASAIAMYRSERYAAVGLEYVKMNGNSVDAYVSTTGELVPYLGSIASNGDITLLGNSRVEGNAHPGPGRRVIGANRVHGSTSPLPAPLNFPALDPGDARTNNDNWRAPSYAISGDSFYLKNDQSATLPGGVYYFKDFTTETGSQLRLDGQVFIYIYGTLSMSGNATTAANQPRNLKLMLVRGPDGAAPGSMTISSTTQIYAEIHAPLSAATITGNGDVMGSLIARNLSMTGNGKLRYDASLRAGVALVR